MYNSRNLTIRHCCVYVELPSCHWHPDGRAVNELAESLDSQTASLLAHDETDSVHEIRLSCGTK